MTDKDGFNNITGFLKETSVSQGFLKYNADTNEYVFNTGNASGQSVVKLLTEYKDEISDLFSETYDHEESNYHTKQLIKDVAKRNDLVLNVWCNKIK